MIRFIDREEELEQFQTAWKKPKAAFIVLYGRRRIGKSRLIQEFAKDKKGIYFIAEDINKKVQLKEFKNSCARFLGDTFLEKIDIAEWRDLFEYLQKTIPKNQKFYIAIDEFSYIIKNDPAVLSALQKFWDIFLSETQIFLLVSGSLFGLMIEKVLSSASPLYGRRTRDIHLLQMRAKDAFAFLNTTLYDQIKIFLAIGGVPEYLGKAADYKDSTEFFQKEFFQKNGYFFREPYFLLSQEFKEIKTYFTILNACAFGKTKPGEIADFAGIHAREIYPYLENLIRFGFIKKEISLFGKRNEGIYLIKDPLFDFWFNFVYANRERIETNAFKPDKAILEMYFGKRFEQMMRDEIIEQFGEFTKKGRWWHKEEEIDCIALHEEKKEIVFIECKWKEKVNAAEILGSLRKKAEHIDWNKETRKEKYIVIAKSFAKSIKEENAQLLLVKDIFSK